MGRRPTTRAGPPPGAAGKVRTASKCASASSRATSSGASGARIVAANADGREHDPPARPQRRPHRVQGARQYVAGQEDLWQPGQVERRLIAHLLDRLRPQLDAVAETGFPHIAPRLGQGRLAWLQPYHADRLEST